MSETLDVHILTVPLSVDDWAGNSVTQRILRAPAAGQGGGITLLAAYAVNEAATTAGTAFALQLENHGTAGTAIKASGGTVGSVGGTADLFAAGVPKAFALANARLAAGEWLVLRKTETASSDPTRGSLNIHYIMGQ